MGIATIAIVVFLFLILLASKPDADAYSSALSVKQNSYAVLSKISKAELSMILQFAPVKSTVLVPPNLTLFNTGNKLRRLAIMQITVNLNNEVDTYIHWDQ